MAFPVVFRSDEGKLQLFVMQKVSKRGDMLHCLEERDRVVIVYNQALIEGGTSGMKL